MFRILTLVAAVVAALGAAPMAHASDDSFMAALATKGVFPTWTTPASAIVDAGHTICATGSAAGTVLAAADMLGVPVVQVARQELCP
ncbi:hypothetical protein BST33_00160 [Mycolicibacter minnesotensis]|uniref:Uncharacterized protein n=1 Tax=Mycolicibacter minnesotensis TaxID=1118379 RepID=A0A7I7R8J4_9MYCO|nr:hypothetical protein BST33_00160 [Mycolicibacter minnesotensis]BBY34931.1 hypothetical protein MMIN_29920 [Mycolicibacter minnesotensis]